MRDIIIRGNDDDVVLRLDELASKKNMSRESYLRAVLKSVSISGELRELDYKYANLVNLMMDQSKMLSDIVDRNTDALDMTYSLLEGIINGK